MMSAFSRSILTVHAASASYMERAQYVFRILESRQFHSTNVGQRDEFDSNVAYNFPRCDYTTNDGGCGLHRPSRTAIANLCARKVNIGGIQQGLGVARRNGAKQLIKTGGEGIQDGRSRTRSPEAWNCGARPTGTSVTVDEAGEQYGEPECRKTGNAIGLQGVRGCVPAYKTSIAEILSKGVELAGVCRGKESGTGRPLHEKRAGGMYLQRSAIRREAEAIRDIKRRDKCATPAEWILVKDPERYWRLELTGKGTHFDSTRLPSFIGLGMVKSGDLCDAGHEMADTRRCCKSAIVQLDRTSTEPEQSKTRGKPLGGEDRMVERASAPSRGNSPPIAHIKRDRETMGLGESAGAAGN
ncbi:hypothetical protein C8R47DRAFT_1203811 [Mycena vitilis]|nr:hypothetical protein C8R47DRAFT_1203811 [Mycena vitilis]